MTTTGRPATLAFLVTCAAVLAPEGPPAADAASYCEVLGEAGKYSAVATRAFRSRGLKEYANANWNIPFLGPVCTPSAIHHVGDISFLVATRTSGTAARFQKLPYEENAILEAVFTGGGGVAFSGKDPDIDHPQIGRIDTSGTHPAVADCLGVSAAMDAASADLAARPPTHTFGSVVVDTNEVFTIDVTGVAEPVIEIDTLVLKGTKLDFRWISATCEHGGARLEVLRDPGVEVLFNVRRLLRFGHCYQLGVQGARTFFNVVGTGPSVTIGMDDDLSAAPTLIAPRRNVSVDGVEREYESTSFGTVIGAKVETEGEVWLPTYCSAYADDSVFDQ